MFFLGGALGAVYVVIIVFVQNTLHSGQSGTKDLGLIIMFLGLGLFLGSLLYGRFGQRLPYFKAIFSSLIISGLVLAIFVLSLTYYPYFLLAVGLAFILGLAVSPVIITCNTLIHKSSQNEMMGRVFSSIDFLLHFAFILFMFLSSLLAEHIPSHVILIILACLFIILGVFNLIFQRKIPWLN